ncbi:MAG: AbrB/MazE/SpoVT family DNA-binding domain-containing protein [Acidobacteriota bacterium]
MSDKASVARVSSKYQIVIPLEVRDKAGIRPGTRFELVVTASGLRLIRLGQLTALRGTVRRDDHLAIRNEGERV